jgi:hypothetical protein
VMDILRMVNLQCILEIISKPIWNPLPKALSIKGATKKASAVMSYYTISWSG